MMHYASQGVRSATRKGSNVLVHHGGHNGPGGSTTANPKTRSLSLANNILVASKALHPPTPFINSLEAIRPRNPPHKLFSISKNFLSRLFTHLTAPGLRAPSYLSQAKQAGSRSLHNSVTSVQSGLSFAARSSIRNNALHRQANIFLPRAPAPAPPRFGGVTQVGLGTAKNFSTGRPIFQHLVENVPIAGRALYEADFDVGLKTEQTKMRYMVKKQTKSVEKSKEMLKPSQKANTPVSQGITQELDYFPEAEVARVTTCLLIPLAPTPSARMPLDPDMHTTREPSLLPPLPYLGALHMDYSTHTLRVSTLFTRLDQANVWSRGGVSCSAYSQGQSYRRRSPKDQGGTEGVCNVLKVEFVGWTKTQVRKIIGESGDGWCTLEEFYHDWGSENESLSDLESLASEISEETMHYPRSPDTPEVFGQEMFDPARSFVLPTLDFSASSSISSPSTLSPYSSYESVVGFPLDDIGRDPWVDDYSDSSSSSSSEDMSDWMIEPPSTNGYFGQNHGLGLGVGFSSHFADARERLEPREGMFY